jgi:hypothetical protein
MPSGILRRAVKFSGSTKSDAGSIRDDASI